MRRPKLVHYRVLFGPPRHQILKDHPLRLVKIRDRVGAPNRGGPMPLG